jgi:hypothetical protein
MVLITGAERACQTMFHLPRSKHRMLTSFRFGFSLALEIILEAF